MMSHRAPVGQGNCLMVNDVDQQACNIGMLSLFKHHDFFLNDLQETVSSLDASAIVAT